MDLLASDGPLYETTGAKITGVSVDDQFQYLKKHGSKHPARQIGKTGELAFGYQGGVAAWKKFDPSGTYTDDQIQGFVNAWRLGSPNIVNLWYGLQRIVTDAIQNPGRRFNYRDIKAYIRGQALKIELLNGRCLSYAYPRISREHGYSSVIVYEHDNGKGMWCETTTYGGKLCENVVQAVARDILADAILRLEDQGYPVVLHVHDEIISEVSNSIRSKTVEEFENIMNLHEPWAKGIPVKAAGGWRGRRFKK